MRKIILTGLVVTALIGGLLGTSFPVAASGNTMYVDDDFNSSTPGWGVTHFSHPQDAVNAASSGDTILVYPGVYRERVYTSPKPPHWGPGDQYAPPLIVFKDNLTIKAIEEDPSLTIIECSPTYNFWVNKYFPNGGGGGSIEHSTGGSWDSVNKVWLGNCVRPKFGTAPNAIAIIASGVTIDGFTIRRPFDFTSGTYNTAGVMIGGLYAGYGGAGETLGYNNNTVQNCVFEDVWHAVYIWHSSDNRILNNTVAALNTNHWAAISTYDGYNDAQISLGNLSENNLIAHNALANKGIALGAWEPPTWTSNAGSIVCCNNVTQVGVTYSHGPVIIGCNTGGLWQYNTDKVIRIKGINYTGDVELWSVSNIDVNLSAQLDYDGSSDGSGIDVTFTVNGNDYTATTVSGGTASTTVNLPPGNYTVTTKVAICNKCAFTDVAELVIGKIITIDIKPGSDPNSINLKAKGVVPVAILSTAEFDPATVDPETVVFAGATPVRWILEDLNGDSQPDMLLHFNTQDLKLDSGSREAVLTGFTEDGTPIKGTDSVNIVPREK